MKYIPSVLALCLCLALTLSLGGCTQNEVTGTSVPSAPASSQTAEKDVTLDISYARYWTWNDLYDYLESPLQSGQLSFDASAGERLVLYLTDGVTPVTDWDTPLKDGMLAVLYEADDSIIRRFAIRITDAPVISQPESSVTEVPSVVSVPDPDESEPSSVPADPEPAEKTVITVRGKSNKALKKAVDAFNKQSQTVTVVLTDGELTITADGLKSEQNTSVCPDVVLMDHSQYKTAAAKGLLTPFNAADQAPFGLTEQQNCYGILLGHQVWCTAANKDLLYHCGATLPSTFGEMVTAAEQIHSVLPEVLPIGLATKGEDAAHIGRQFSDLLTAQGGRLLTTQGDAAAFYSNSGMQVMDLYQKLYQDGLIAMDNAAEDFVKGNTAFGVVSSADYEQVFGKQARHNYAPISLLLPGEHDTAGLRQSYYYCVPKGENKDKIAAAYEFLTYLLTDVDTLTALCKTAGVVPAHPAVRQDKYYRTEAWQILITAADEGYDPPELDCMDTIYGYVAEAVLATLNGQDGESALARAKDLTESRLARQ